MSTEASSAFESSSCQLRLSKKYVVDAVSPCCPSPILMAKSTSLQAHHWRDTRLPKSRMDVTVGLCSIAHCRSASSCRRVSPTRGGFMNYREKLGRRCCAACLLMYCSSASASAAFLDNSSIILVGLRPRKLPDFAQRAYPPRSTATPLDRLRGAGRSD
jgi:hypothetical protein